LSVIARLVFACVKIGSRRAFSKPRLDGHSTLVGARG
jgi:hypothetical protein